MNRNDLFLIVAYLLVFSTGFVIKSNAFYIEPIDHDIETGSPFGNILGFAVYECPYTCLPNTECTASGGTCVEGTCSSGCCCRIVSSDCTCDDWYPGNCGESGCDRDERYYYRTCDPSGCDIESKCVQEAGCTDACDTDSDCDDGNVCTIDSCNDPSSSSSTCSNENKASGTSCGTCKQCDGDGSCINSPSGTDCGNCKQCDGYGGCEYLCLGTESSCECSGDSCIDCSATYGTWCGYGTCNEYYKPSWECSDGSCTYECSYSKDCESDICSNYDEFSCIDKADCKWCDSCEFSSVPSRSLTSSNCISSTSECTYECVVGSCDVGCCSDDDCDPPGNACNNYECGDDCETTCSNRGEQYHCGSSAPSTGCFGTNNNECRYNVNQMTGPFSDCSEDCYCYSEELCDPDCDDLCDPDLGCDTAGASCVDDGYVNPCKEGDGGCLSGSCDSYTVNEYFLPEEECSSPSSYEEKTSCQDGYCYWCGCRVVKSETSDSDGTTPILESSIEYCADDMTESECDDLSEEPTFSFTYWAGCVDPDSDEGETLEGCCYGGTCCQSGYLGHTCYYNVEDLTKEACEPLCKWDVDHYNWVGDVSNECTSGGWSCDSSSGTIVDTCTGDGCCDPVCDSLTGCGEPDPNDANCEEGYICNLKTCECELSKECRSNTECPDGQCCLADSDGPEAESEEGGYCVSQGFIDGNYLCD